MSSSSARPFSEAPRTARARARFFLVVVCGSAASAIALSGPPAAAQNEDPGVVVDVPPDDAYSDTDPSALVDFRPALDPYGSWVEDPTYGTTWTPSPEDVGPDFAPYASAGRWDYAGNDYTWVSDYVWGAVCFHYGRWVSGGGRWLWVPGRRYAGAWVDWRIGDATSAVVGWAPMAPAWTWVSGSAVAFDALVFPRWAFSPFGELFAPTLRGRLTWVNPEDAAPSFWAHTRPYVHAQPVVVGGVRAQAPAHGPPPAALGIDLATLKHATLSASEIRARQMARPSSAVALGARAPTAHVVLRRGPSVPRVVVPVPRAPAGHGRR